jgi:hypothetical protein
MGIKAWNPSNLRVPVASALAVLVTAAAIAAVPASAREARAHAAGGSTCHLTRHDWTSYGYSYFEWLWVDRTSCGTGYYVAHRHGHVRGWGCSRKITAKSRFQYAATETCTSSGRIVQWKYSQNT